MIEVDPTIQAYRSGQMATTTRSAGFFKVLEFHAPVENRPYTAADSLRMPYDTVGDFLTNEKILENLAELYRVMNINKPLPEHSPDFNTFKIAHLVGFSLEQEYELLCMPEEMRRQQYMLAHLEQLLPTAREMEELRKKVQLNGHFKNILPPQV